MADTEHPSQHREAIDHVWSALSPEEERPLKDVVTAAGVDRAVVQKVLALAKAGGVADGVNGKWSRTNVSRTSFRDAVVRGAITAEGATMTGLVQAFDGVASRPQVYNSLARLRAAGEVTNGERDGTRSPVYKPA